MPSLSEITWFAADPLAAVFYKTTDPRREGRVDCAIFPFSFYEFLTTRKIQYKSGEFYVDGLSFTKFFAKAYHRDIRIEPNGDYFLRNYTFRDSPSNTIPKEEIEYHTAVKYQRNSDTTTVTISCQAGIEVKILINSCLVHHVPTRMFFPKGKNGLYFIDRNLRRSYNDRHGQSLAAFLLQKLGVEHPVGSDVSRSDVFDYRIDMETIRYISSPLVKNTYTEHDETTILTLKYPSAECWTPLDKGEMWRNDEDFELNIAVPTQFVSEIRELVWRYEPIQHEITAKDEDGKRVILKRKVAILAGMEIGETVIPSRMTRLYEKAVNEDDYTARAKFENTEFGNQKGVNRRFTIARHLRWRRVVADKQVEVGGIICLDMRPESIRVCQ